MKLFLEPGPKIKPNQGCDELEPLNCVKNAKVTSTWTISNRWLSDDYLYTGSLFRYKTKRDFKRPWYL